MATKKITKIISTENGENFVADIEDIENRITQNSSNLETAKQELSNKCNEALSEAKAYTDQEKAKYLPLTGGTVTGSLNCTASNATADVNNKELTSYVADIMGANAQLSIIKGDGTTSVISINNVLNATKATNADNATNLGGYPATDYIRSVNGINADENGNIQLGSIVKSVNSIAPDENGNISLISEDATTSSEAITIDDNSSNNISLTTASEITVANGTVGKAWNKSVKITNSDSTITLGSSWSWVNDEVPTLSANSLLVLKWCYDFGIAGLVKITG